MKPALESKIVYICTPVINENLTGMRHLKFMRNTSKKQQKSNVYSKTNDVHFPLPLITLQRHHPRRQPVVF
jgi:hypothetical protein